MLFQTSFHIQMVFIVFMIHLFRNETLPNGTSIEVRMLAPTDLRMNRNYIIGYVHWTWTITTVIIPFVLLVFLSTQIFLGLKKVKKNLNRHKRLQIKAEAKAATTTNGKSVKVTVNGENQILSKFFNNFSHTKSISLFNFLIFDNFKKLH